MNPIVRFVTQIGSVTRLLNLFPDYDFLGEDIQTIQFMIGFYGESPLEFVKGYEHLVLPILTEWKKRDFSRERIIALISLTMKNCRSEMMERGINTDERIVRGLQEFLITKYAEVSHNSA